MKMKSRKFIGRFGSEFKEFRAFALRVNAVITFIIVALMLFFFVVRPLNGLRGRLGLNGDEPLPMAPCPACRSDIDLRARRCPMCTEVLTDGWAGAAQ